MCDDRDVREDDDARSEIEDDTDDDEGGDE